MKMKYEKYDNKYVEYEKRRQYFAKHLRIAARNPCKMFGKFRKLQKYEGIVHMGLGEL